MYMIINIDQVVFFYNFIIFWAISHNSRAPLVYYLFLDRKIGWDKVFLINIIYDEIWY